jgi:hypothetical protein
MKKALAGPAKRTAKKKPERRAMIAAARRRIRTASRGLGKRLRGAAPALLAASRRADRWANRQLQRAWPPLTRAGRRARALAGRWGRRLRPLGVLVFRFLGMVERRLLQARDLAIRATTRASAVLTPERAICATILASAACLLAAQFVDYRAVQIGQPGYAGLPVAAPPAIDARTAGEAHAYLLIPIALLAAALALLAARTPRRRADMSTRGRHIGPSASRSRGLGRLVFGLGLLSLAVILLVDLPAGLDVGVQASRFSGAKAVLYDGFYAQIAAAAGLMLGGALLILAPKAAARYHARPCRTRTSSFARAASALRRRRRRRASSRARGARSASRRRSGGASAPASPR